MFLVAYQRGKRFRVTFLSFLSTLLSSAELLFLVLINAAKCWRITSFWFRTNAANCRIITFLVAYHRRKVLENFFWFLINAEKLFRITIFLFSSSYFLVLTNAAKCWRIIYFWFLTNAANCWRITFLVSYQRRKVLPKWIIFVFLSTSKSYWVLLFLISCQRRKTLQNYFLLVFLSTLLSCLSSQVAYHRRKVLEIFFYFLSTPKSYSELPYFGLHCTFLFFSS